jgi:hypothetical protein
MGWMEAAYGIDQNLTEEGPFLKDNLEVIRAAGKPTLADIAKYAFMSAGNNLRTIYHVILRSNAFGSPLLLILVVVGLFRTIWTHERILYESFIALILLSICLILLSVQHFWERFAFPLLPFLILWASKGIAELAEWMNGTVASFKTRYTANKIAVQTSTQWALSIALINYATTGYIGEFKRMRLPMDPVKEAGLWLANYAGGPNRVMSSSSVFAYYSGGTWLPFPYSESSLALRYLYHKRPNFIVLASDGADTRPYLREWIDGEFEDVNAKLIYEKSSPDGERIKIYQWTSPPSNGIAQARGR